MERVSDEALLAAMGTGDHQAAEILVRRHQRRIFGVAYAITGDPRVAEDVAQEAFLRIWRHAANFDPARSVASAWMARIARNLSIDHLRARRADPVDPAVLLALAERVRVADTVESEAARRDGVDRVRAALAALPQAQRRALVLASFYGYTATEIAAVDQLPVGTVKGRIRMGLQKMRVALNTEGWER